ncbi:MAG TPA: CCA tRNA nucleotidyltransferase [Candidatus Limnocylindria bacterium]
MQPGREITIADLPRPVADVLATLRAAGHEAVLVGGCVRDHLLGRPGADWDAATSALPEQVVHLLPGASWENRFGTVTVLGPPPVEVTSYRTEGEYRDGRRPDEVRFGASLVDDLARRDFTINAMAWLPADLDVGRGRLIDPFGGERDLAAAVLRTVGDPRERFGEDALRLVRAARLAARDGMTIEPATEAAIVALAPSAAAVSGERIRDELLRILAHPLPSVAFALLERLELLGVILPELAALRGIPQAKAVPGDALDHTLRAVDSAPPADADLRLAALLHDLGKATTLGGGHFIGHEDVGADLADGVLRRLRVARAKADRIVGVIRQHMYAYDSTWTDAAVRRFIRRLSGVDRELLFALRRVDNAASGVGPGAETNQLELEARIAEQLEREPALLVHRRLAIDGDDLQRELGLAPGPELGALLDRLTELVLEDPSRNERSILLALARGR